MPVPQIVKTPQGPGTFSWTDGSRYKVPTSSPQAEFSESYKQLLLKLRIEKKKKEAETDTEKTLTMGKSTILAELDDVYNITVMQYSNKGIIFVLSDKITNKEVDRFLWEYPIYRGNKGNIKRFE